jgi:hypothetical protein
MGVHCKRVRQGEMMRKLRYLLITLWMLLFSVTYAKAQVGIGIGLPNVSIGINLPSYPELVRVPNYPVYYAPQMDANYFFYDGMYWVYRNDTWYASSWYNGPWGAVEPNYVPLYILRVPVRYYRQPPVYFRGWASTRPPRWGQHWGDSWEHRRSGWNRWNRNAAPAPAPLPVYQRQYAGDRYPRVEQQHMLRSQQYRYQPRDKMVRQHLEQAAPVAAPHAPAAAPPVRRTEPPKMAPRQPEHSPVVQPPQTRPAVPHHQQQQPPAHITPPSQVRPVVPQHQPEPRVVPPPQARPAVPHQQQQPPAHVTPPPQVRPVVPHQQPQRGIEQSKKPDPVHAPPQAVHQQKPQTAPAAQRQKEQKNQERQQQPEHGRGQDNDDDRGGRGHK